MSKYTQQYATDTQLDALTDSETKFWRESYQLDSMDYEDNDEPIPTFRQYMGYHLS